MYENAIQVCFATILLLVCTYSDILHFSDKFSYNTDFKIVPERGQLNYVNKSLADVKMKVFVYNRTIKPLNISFHFYKELTEESTVYHDIYQFKSNQYKLTAIQFPLKVYQMLQMEWFGLDLFASSAVPPMKWPLKTNVTYRISNWYPNSSLFTFSYNPSGHWKANANWYLDSQKKMKICEYDYYISIDEVNDRY